MRETKIHFTGHSVRGIIDGSKTQTRRIIKPKNGGVIVGVGGPGIAMERISDSEFSTVVSPYGQAGDLLYVREAWQYADWTDDGYPWIGYQADRATRLVDHDISEEWSERLTDIWSDLSAVENYGIDNKAADRRWRQSIHMPRWASRINLEIVGVRVELLHDISEEDAKAEGIFQIGEWDCFGESRPLWWFEKTDERSCGMQTAASAYACLWEKINGPGSWNANPWVWAISFKRVQP